MLSAWPGVLRRGSAASSGRRAEEEDRDAPPPLEEGALLAPGLRVVGLLARGGRVDTYDAVSDERDCRVVVKQVRPDRAHESHVRDSLLHEGRLLQEATHPHLVRAYEVHEGDAGQEDAVPATVVLETLPGATLTAIIDDGPIDTGDVVVLGLQLVSALGYLHRLGWLHLDLKPDNVVVREGQAVIIDLGMAAPPGPTRAGHGTRGYLAPEQARGDLVSAATDVWGLGVTLAEAATGNLPHGEEGTWDAGPRRIGRRRLPRPSLRGVDRDLREVLLDCLRLDPAERPSLDDVRARLTALR